MTQLKLATATRRDVEEFYADGGTISDHEFRVLSGVNPEAWSMAISEQGYIDAGRPTPLQTKREAEKKKRAPEPAKPAILSVVSDKFDGLEALLKRTTRSVEARLASLESQPAPNNDQRFAEIEKRLAEIEKQVLALLPNAAMLTVASAVTDLQRTMAAPVVAVYDKGKVIGSKREIPQSADASTVAGLQKRIDEIEARPAMTIQYCGVWEAARQYNVGNLVTDKGSLFHCNRSTRSRPGEGGDWTLAAKRGADGRDAR